MTTLLAPPDTAPTDAATVPRQAAPPHMWAGFAVILSAMVLNILDSTIVNVAAPAIQADLSMSTSSLEWVAAAYTLALAVGLMAGARLGDMFGRRRMLLLGLGGFVVSSALCSFAWSADVLVGLAGAPGSGRGRPGAAGLRHDPRRLPAAPDRQGVRRDGTGDRALDRARSGRRRAADEGRPVRHRLARAVPDQPADRRLRAGARHPGAAVRRPVAPRPPARRGRYGARSRPRRSCWCSRWSTVAPRAGRPGCSRCSPPRSRCWRCSWCSSGPGCGRDGRRWSSSACCASGPTSPASCSRWCSSAASSASR